MATGTVVQLKGYREVERMLATLDKKVARKHVSKAFRAGAKVIEKQAEANAPVGKDRTVRESTNINGLKVLSNTRTKVKGGRLRKSIKVRTAKSKTRGKVAFIVTTGAKDSLFKGKTFYGAFQELGYRIGKRNAETRRAQTAFLKARKSGNAERIRETEDYYDSVDLRVRVDGKRFMRRAYQSHGKQAVGIIERELLKGVQQEARAK